MWAKEGSSTFRLEAPLQGGVFLEVLAVLVEVVAPMVCS